jgi:hypothetical protein
LIPAECQAAQTLTSSLVLPSQENRRGSKFADGRSNSGAATVERPIVAIAVPSRGAT